jgi:hypothetical protein
MKNLATCKPSEFLKQTLRIKRLVEKWLTSEDIAEIRKRLPKKEAILNTMTKEEQGEVLLRNQKATKEQAMKNFMDILDIMLDKKFDETLAVIALSCFVEPENVDDYTIDDYLGSLSDMLENRNVIRFFASVAHLGQTNISLVSKE